MSFDELYAKILDILPTATMGDDEDGQIVIYTNLRMQNADEESVEPSNELYEFEE